MSSILEDLKSQYNYGGIVQKLIFWNIACFIFSYVFFGLLKMTNINFDVLDYLSLSSNIKDLMWKPWSLLTYCFFHSDFFHIFFNMIILNFSGQLFLTFFNQKQFLGLFLLGAFFSGILYVVLFYLMNIFLPIVGASGAIMSILVATTTYKPLMNVRLMLIGNVRLWQITLTILVLDLLQLQIDNSGGHIAHLAGAFFGFIYIKLLLAGKDLSEIVTQIIDFFANIFKSRPKKAFKKVHKNYNYTEQKTVSKIITKDKKQQQIDEILDKISQSGYDCLSKEEKEFLFKAGK